MILTIAMAHPRTLIRQAVIALLAAANTAAGARVEDTRIDPIRNSKLPLISVYAPHEPAESGDSEPRELKREVTVEVVAWVARTDAESIGVTMDNIALQIEAAMDGARYLSGAAGDSVLEDTELQVRNEDGRSDPMVGVVIMTYLVTYRTDSMATAAALDDFLRAKVGHKVTGGVADTVPASDEFNVQEP